MCGLEFFNTAGAQWLKTTMVYVLHHMSIAGSHCFTTLPSLRDTGSTFWNLDGHHGHVSHALNFKGFSLEVVHAIAPHISSAKTSHVIIPNFKRAGNYNPTKKFLEGVEVEILANSN